MTDKALEELSIHVHNYGQLLPYETFYDGKNCRTVVLDELIPSTYKRFYMYQARQQAYARFVRDVANEDIISYIHNDEASTAEAWKTFLNSIYGVGAKMVKMAKTTTIKSVHFSGPCTIVIWNDGTKTMVRQNMDKDPVFDPEKGLALAIAKYFLGTNKNKSNYYDEFKKWLPKKEANSVDLCDECEFDDARKSGLISDE